MILLFGGTGETGAVADALVEGGYRVLVSTATDISLSVGTRYGIERRWGKMDEAAICRLVEEKSVRAIVDVAHPFAAVLHQTARGAAEKMGVPYFRYDRVRGGEFAESVRVRDHRQAAVEAFRFGEVVLLTTGSNNLRVYVEESERTGVPLYARVLDDERSLKACREAGMREDRVIARRGPFSVEENRELLRRIGAGVMVTKDSGKAGGVAEKMEAAEAEKCRVVLISRPEDNPEGYGTVEELLTELGRTQAGVVSLALDLESVLVPEIWRVVGERIGEVGLGFTTREQPDYEELMRGRLEICRRRGLTLGVIQEIVREMELLPGAGSFLREAGRWANPILITDTFEEFLEPLLDKVGAMPVFCNRLLVGEGGELKGWELRRGGKRGEVERLQRRGREVWVVGDSYNDLPMCEVAHRAFLYRPPEELKGREGFSIVREYDEILGELRSRDGGIRTPNQAVMSRLL